MDAGWVCIQHTQPMIEKTSAYKTSDGQTFATLEQAQQHALTAIGFVDETAASLLKQKDDVIAILKLKLRKSKAKKAVKTPTAKGAQ